MFYVLENESEVKMGSKIQLKIYEHLQNEQFNEITSESPYSVLAILNINPPYSSQVGIVGKNNFLSSST